MRFATQNPSLLAKELRPRRRPGSTSPQLMCVEKNPGPKAARRRLLARDKLRNKRRERKPKLSEIQRGQILMGIKNGFSNREIARQLQIAESTVRLWRERYIETGALQRKRNPGSGRPRKLTKAEERHLIIRCILNRRLSGLDLAKETTTKDGKMKVMPRTVRRILNRRGLKGRTARKKPYLTAVHMQKRIKWAYAHRDWTIEDWKHVVWSDESSIQLWSNSRVSVRRRDGESQGRLYGPNCER